MEAVDLAARADEDVGLAHCILLEVLTVCSNRGGCKPRERVFFNDSCSVASSMASNGTLNTFPVA